ncbi:putative hepatocyte growth factor-like, partial [Trypanosoma cruzi]
RGFPYEGPFWLNESTNVTAVINGEHLVRASYVFITTGAILEMYPASGKYIGGVSCLVYQSDPQANNTISINGLSWQPLSEFVFILDTVGINVVGVRSISLGGVMNAVWRKYGIVEAIPPVLLPAPDVVYTEPIRVTCKDPMGRALAVDKKDEELIYSIRLDTPGRFSVNCTYLDDLHNKRSAHAVYELEPIPLPMPLLRPECGRSFPMIPLLLVTTIVPPPDAGCERDPWRLGLNASSTGATLRKISGNGSFLLQPTQTDA